ncbi:hypothetical protein [Exiguobacterium flavidum]|uniref:hypothetical protein n=1 Tax=Exiguobacterium flavidum TaxID=2184695 RepID=UPI000DF7A6D7|nr:hypothetical protein [Exiguobacterium flavidum]
MKRSYIVYTTSLAVVVGLILCVLFVFSKPEIRAQIGETFQKIETQSKHQATLKQKPAESPNQPTPQPEEPLIKDIQQMLYDDSIGSYLVVTEDYHFFEVSGTGDRINASFMLENERNPLLLGALDGMALVDGETVALLTTNQVLVTINREDGVWREEKREKISGTTVKDNFHGLGYDADKERFFTINDLWSNERVELTYFAMKEDVVKVSPKATAKEKKNAERNKRPPYLSVTAREAIRVQENAPSDVKKAFKDIQPIGLAKRQDRLYTLDSEELFLYSIDPEKKTVTGESTSPKVYGAQGIFLQDNELFALIDSTKFSNRSFIPID